MKSRPADIEYCGVRKEVIQNATPVLNDENLQHMRTYIQDRYTVRLKKDVAGQPAPWTNNPVLRKYKFTNVRREHDRVSRELIRLVSHNDDLDLTSKIYNSFLLRAWNNPETFVDFGGPWHWKEIESPELKEKVRPIYHQLLTENPKRKWWSAAYNQGGTKYAWKFPDGEGFSRAASEYEGSKFPDFEKDIPLRVFHIGPWLARMNTWFHILRAKDQEEVFNAISKIKGYSTFMAYQTFVDLTYIPEFPFSENEYTVAGPGCRRGIDLVFEDRDGMTHEEAIFWLRDKEEVLGIDFKYLFGDLPKHDRCINVMSLENCFCELSKYVRTVNGTGRPKVKYPGEGK